MIPKFTATITAGKLIFDTPTEVQEHIRKLEGKEVEVIIKKHRKLRTDPQMAYYWGVVVKLLSEYTGYEAEEMHEILKDQFAPLKEVKLGKEVKMIHGCTHDLFTDNFFTDYIERIQRWAAQELGVVIPDPPRVDIQ
jgi:hypothetical protein